MARAATGVLVAKVVSAAARAYATEATTISRVLVPHVCRSAANSMIGNETSYVLQIGSSVYKVIPPSEVCLENPSTLYDKGFNGGFDKASGGLILHGFCAESMEMKKLAHLSLIDHANHIRTHGAPMLPMTDDDKGHWPRMQIGVYPSDNLAWATLFDGKGMNFSWLNTIILPLSVVISSGVNYLKYEAHSPKGLVFEAPITSKLLESLRVKLSTHYILSEVLGDGSESMVYRGRCIVDPHVAALKVLRNKTKTEPVESFILKHNLSPLVRPLITSGREDSGKVFLSLKFFKRTVKLEIESEAEFDFDTRMCRFIDECDAVQSLLDQKIHHRDINLGNFLVDVDGCAILCDLGSGEFVEGSGTPMLGRGQSSIWCAPERTKSNQTITITDKAEVFPLGILYLVESTKGLATKSIDKFVKDFVNMTRTPEWKKNPVATFRQSDFFKAFHGNVDLLVSAVSYSPDNRPTVLEFSRKASQG